MNLLGLDTSTSATAVCVQRADGRTFELRAGSASLDLPPRHAAELMPAIEDLLEAAGLGPRDLDAVAVGTGPGTFTGLRIGIATARALAQATGVPVRPVSSLAALAAGVDAALVIPTIDARRGELFAALHDAHGARWAPFMAAPGELAERVSRGLAEWSTRPLAVGGGSLRFRDVLESVAVEVPPDESQLHVIRASYVCRLAAGVPAVPPEAVLPTYLRAPDARPSR